MSDHVAASQQSAVCTLDRTHRALREDLAPLLDERGALLCVPMPHTSGLAWNRTAPDGRKWSEIGAAQVALATHLASREN